MDIKTLASLLEAKISERMNEFMALGSRAKLMYMENKPKEEIDRIHFMMAEIFHELGPVEWIVREQYKPYNELFNSLNKLRKDMLRATYARHDDEIESINDYVIGGPKLSESH